MVSNLLQFFAIIVLIKTAPVVFSGGGHNNHRNRAGWGGGNQVYPGWNNNGGNYGGNSGWSGNGNTNHYGQQQFQVQSPYSSGSRVPNKNQVLKPSSCPRPEFNDDAAKFLIENCSGRGNGNRVCQDSSLGIPIGWKVFLLCRQNNVRMRLSSTCLDSGKWTREFPADCSEIFSKYSNQLQNHQDQKVPLILVNNNPSTTTTTSRPSFSNTEDDTEFEETLPLPQINVHRKQCPMLQMQLSDNFEFFCLLRHLSRTRTENCLNYRTVASGSIAVLQCKPPYYSAEGQGSIWICEGGSWKGTFNKLRCYYGRKPETSRPTTTLKPILSSTASSTPNTPIPPWWVVPTFETSTYSPTTPTRRTSMKPVSLVPLPIYPASSTTTQRIQPRPTNPTSSTPSSENDGFDYFDYFTSTLETTESPRPSISPVSTFPSLTTPTSASTTTTTTIAPVNTTLSSQTCPALSPRSPGMVLECISKLKPPSGSSSSQTLLSSCDTPQLPGTEAKYFCKPLYESTTGLVSIYRKCKEDGTWAGNPDTFSCIPECGRKNDVFTPYITVGTPSFRGEWPWHVAIFQRKTDSSSPSQWEYICGGELISKRTILTAAHCVTFSESSKVRELFVFRFHLGQFDLSLVDESVQAKEAQSIHLPSSYNPFGFDSDIAIIILKDPVDLGFRVRPICYPKTLNTAQDEIMLSPESVGVVVGWGLNEDGVQVQKLQKTELRVVSPKDCSVGTQGVGGGRLQIKSTTYCAGPTRNESKQGLSNVCRGDSGGGMYFSLTTSNSDWTRWHLQGIVSVGVGDENNKCKPEQPSFFTRVASYADWIVRIMSENDAL